MSNELIRPLDPESARAIEETAKAASAAIDAAVKTGQYASDAEISRRDLFNGVAF
jgi:hypothetical protein